MRSQNHRHWLEPQRGAQISCWSFLLSGNSWSETKCQELSQGTAHPCVCAGVNWPSSSPPLSDRGWRTKSRKLCCDTVLVAVIKRICPWLRSRGFMTSVKRQRNQQSFEKSHGITDTKNLWLPMCLGVKDPRSWRERRSRKLSHMLQGFTLLHLMKQEITLDTKQLKCRIHFSVIFHC